MSIKREIYNAAMSEIINERYLKLKKDNEEYKELRQELLELYEKNPTVEGVISGDSFSALSRNESEKVRDVILIKDDMNKIEEVEIFMLGAKEMYFILKKLDLLK